MCSATLMAELISVHDGLSNISFCDGNKFAYDSVLRCYNFFKLYLHFSFLVIIVRLIHNK